MRCLECGSSNDENAAICIDCRASLRPARALLYLERAEHELNEGKMSRARANIARFDIEMLTLSPELRERHQLPARSFWVQSLVYYNKGQMNEAKRELLQAEASLEQQSTPNPLLPRVLLKLGNINYYQGRIDEAIFNYLHSSELSAQLGDHATAAKVIGNLGNVYINKQRVDEAATCYEQSLIQARLSGDTDALVQAYRILALLYSQTGPFSLAVKYISDAVEKLTQTINLNVRCTVLAVAGDIYIKANELDRAELYLRQAEAIVLETGNKLNKELVGNILAELMRRRGDLKGWHEYAMLASQVAGSSGLPQTEYALQMAMYYIQLGDEVRARRHLQAINSLTGSDMLETAEDEISLSRAKALLHTMLGEWDKADRNYHEAIEQPSFSKYALAMAWQEYATMLRYRATSQNLPLLFAEADAAYERATTLFQEMGMKPQPAATDYLFSNQQR